MNNLFFIRISGIKLLYGTGLLFLIFSSLQMRAQDNKKRELPEKDLRLNRISGTFMNADGKPGPEHKKLERLIGRWINEGQTIATTGSPALQIVTSDVYEWAPGGFFVIHYAYGRAGNEYGGAVEIIGYDQESKTYRNYAFDSHGILTQEVLTIGNDSLSSLGRYTRCLAVFSNNDNILTAHHERSEDGGKTWLPAMDVRLIKIN
jgi:hypothetical protein